MRLIGHIARTVAGVGALVAFVLVSGCFGGGDDSGSSNGDGFAVTFETPESNNETPTPQVTESPTPTPSPTPSPAPVCGRNPDPVSREVLQVQQPKADAEVKFPIEVRGWGSTIGKDGLGVAVAVVNGSLQVLDVLDVPPQPRAYRVAPVGLRVSDDTRPFGADVVIANVGSPTRMCLWVYLETDAEGQPKQVVQIPVTIVP